MSPDRLHDRCLQSSNGVGPGGPPLLGCAAGWPRGGRRPRRRVGDSGRQWATARATTPKDGAGWRDAADDGVVCEVPLGAAYVGAGAAGRVAAGAGRARGLNPGRRTARKAFRPEGRRCGGIVADPGRPTHQGRRSRRPGCCAQAAACRWLVSLEGTDGNDDEEPLRDGLIKKGVLARGLLPVRMTACHTWAGL